MLEQMRYLTLVGATGHIRTATRDEKEYLVLPVIALVEGVIHPVNAPKPELVRAALFASSLAEWEGRPLFAGHPMNGRTPLSATENPSLLQESFGFTSAPKVDGKRLCMEAWLDPSKMTSGHPARILEAVKSEPPKDVEVSVGVFVNASAQDGVWTNGKRYAAEWLAWKPDHLALFADGRKGACSIEMGCGLPRAAMRVAENGELEDVEETAPMTLKARFAAFFRSLMPRGWGDDEVKQELREALEAIEPSMARGNGEIVRVKNDSVVYCIFPPYNSLSYESGVMPKTTYWQRDYTYDTATQTFNVSAERTQVYPATVYEASRAAESPEKIEESDPTLRAACSCGNSAATAANEVNMDRKARIAALAANPHSPVKSLKMLEAATDEELSALEAKAGELKAAEEQRAKDAADLKTAQDRAVAAEAALKTAQDALAAPVTEDRLPPEYRAMMADRRAEETAKKDGLVNTLKTAQSVYSEEKLKAMSLSELENVAALVKVAQPDYSRPIPSAQRVAADATQNYAPPDPWAKKKTPASVQ